MAKKEKQVQEDNKSKEVGINLSTLAKLAEKKNTTEMSPNNFVLQTRPRSQRQGW